MLPKYYKVRMGLRWQVARDRILEGNKQKRESRVLRILQGHLRAYHKDARREKALKGESLQFLKFLLHEDWQSHS